MKLACYLAGKTSLQQFDEWFVPAAWNVTPASDPEAADLVGEIYLRVAEYTNGDWDEEELKGLLRPHVNRIPISLQFGTSAKGQSPSSNSSFGSTSSIIDRRRASLRGGTTMKHEGITVTPVLSPPRSPSPAPRLLAMAFG